MSTRQENEFQPRSIQDLQGTFKVEKYQRGYKWGPRQVIDLLEDIEEFQIDPLGENFYCLQPVVVVKKGNNVFELIDGQQRVTTIFMILNAIRNEGPHFKIDYETRPGSREFLLAISTLPLLSIPIGDIKSSNRTNFKDSIQNGWKTYIEENPDKNNIDNFHFYQAYQIIRNWFEQAHIQNDTFQKKLLEQTKVIWYEVPNDQPPEQVFMNLNSGKISLTGAELIKALFVLQYQSESNLDIREFKLNELAQEWDQIEYTLQQDPFWYFLVGKQSISYSSRIGLLFDLIMKKPKGKTDELWSYFKYDQIFHDKDKNLNWDEVNKLFQKLRDWYHNSKIYHRIGYLVNTGIASLPQILTSSEEKGKNAFFEALENLIKKEFSKTNKKTEQQPYFIENINYSSNYQAAERSLLWFNILSLERSDPHHRFPFYQYPLSESSLEHIHPQNPKGAKTYGEALDWFSDFVKRESEMEEKQWQEVEAFIKVLKKEPSEKNLSPEIIEKMISIGDALTIDFDLHGISNLALLGKILNSKIGNKRFLEKREILVSIDQGLQDESEGEVDFIPMCTRNVFLKYYSKDPENIQMSFWSQLDAQYYEEAFADMLKDYLPKDSN